MERRPTCTVGVPPDVRGNGGLQRHISSTEGHVAAVTGSLTVRSPSMMHLESKRSASSGRVADVNTPLQRDSEIRSPVLTRSFPEAGA